MVRFWARQEGSSLVEVMAALVLIGLLLPPALGILLHNEALSGMNLYQVAANQLAQAKLDELASEGYNYLDRNYVIQNNQPAQDTPTDGRMQFSRQWTVQPSGLPAGLLQVTVSVSYSFSGIQRTVTAIAYVGIP